MILSKEGEDFIVREEGGVKCIAYQDQVGIVTIGVGHVEPGLKLGDIWPMEKCLEVFRLDLARFESAINTAIKARLAQNEFDALTSFVFNIGVTAFQQSTLLRLLNTGDYKAAAQAMLAWDKGMVNGHLTELPVLQGRRQREKTLFLDGKYA